MVRELTAEEAALLTLEREYANRPQASHNGAKEQAIREQFGWSAVGYYQRLNVLLEEPAAMAADPVTVMRLRRIRRERSQVRRRREERG